MALTSNFQYSEVFLKEAYIKISKIVTGSSDEEYFELDSYGNDVLKFRKIEEHAAHVFVYGNKQARMSGLPPIYAFTVEFDYDSENSGNIYKIAYEAVKKSPKLSEYIVTDN